MNESLFLRSPLMALSPESAAAGAGSDPAVLIMARAPRRGHVRQALELDLGAAGCLALHVALLVGAVEWARAVATRAVYVAHEPADGAGELRRLLGNDVVLFPQNGDGISGRLADAVTRVYARGAGPILIVWPDIPALRAVHAEAAMADLRAGADIVLGPVFDGGFYLIALQRPLPALFRLPESSWRGADARTLVLTAASEEGLQVGLLRAERALHRPADVRAAALDPTLPEGVARVLQRK